ncbi:MAG: response regulator transcription factor [Anaerolineae bacterium]
MPALRILLVDDHTLFRKGLALLLQSEKNLTVVGEASDGFEAIETALALHPDVVLMDIRMPNCDGITAARRIQQQLPATKIIMLTASDEDEDLFAAVDGGAHGYLLKNLEPQQFFAMLNGIAQGKAPMSGVMAAKLLRSLQRPAVEPDSDKTPHLPALSDREIEVLRHVVDGAANHEIAERLHITRNTVKMHLRSILEKLGVQNRVQAAVKAVREGLVEETDKQSGSARRNNSATT